MNAKVLSAALLFGLLHAAAVAAGSVELQPPQPPPEDVVYSTQEIQQKLVEHCMARPDCGESLLSDRSWLDGKIPEYDEESAATGWAELRSRPGGDD